MTKITGYTALTGANVAAGDQTEIVDVSDTAMAVTGTNKSLTMDELRKYLHNPALLDQIADPALPGANQIKLYARKLGGRVHPAWEGPLGVGSSIQATLARNSVSLWQAQAAGTAFSSIGPIGTPTATGTATAVTPATTSLYTYMRKVEALVTTGAATAVAGWRGPQLMVCRGNAATIGGFWFICRWGPATGVATATNRGFCGLRGSNAAPTDVQPSTLTQICGMAWDAADTNIQFMTNAAGTATKADLGASFPVPTADRTKMYELTMFCAPNDTTLYYEVQDLGTGATTGTLSTTSTLPTNTQMLTPQVWMSVGGTSSVIGVGLSSLYIETDY